MLKVPQSIHVKCAIFNSKKVSSFCLKSINAKISASSDLRAMAITNDFLLDAER